MFPTLKKNTATHANVKLMATQSKVVAKNVSNCKIQFLIFNVTDQPCICRGTFLGEMREELKREDQHHSCILLIKLLALGQNKYYPGLTGPVFKGTNKTNSNRTQHCRHVGMCFKEAAKH